MLSKPLILSLFIMVATMVQGSFHENKDEGRGTSPLKLKMTGSKTVGNMTSREFWLSHSNGIVKRHSLEEKLNNNRDLAYFVDVYLGSTNQQVSVIIDTGSSDLWVPSAAYDPEKSTLSRDTGEPFSITYIDGCSVEGTYLIDRFQLTDNRSVLPSFKFARANTHEVGVLGIADRNQQVSSEPYNNLPWALAEAGIIQSPSYSLYLGPSGNSGFLLFGGIDTEKYHGELKKYNRSDSTEGLGIHLISISFGGRTLAIDAPMILDCGTSLGFLSGDIMNELDGIFNTTVFYQNGIEYRATSCEQPTDKTIDFNFGQNVISLTYADAIVRDNDVCMLGFAYLENKQILGDIFLRKAYVYYDLAEKTISLAQAAYSNSSNVVSV